MFIAWYEPVPIWLSSKEAPLNLRPALLSSSLNPLVPHLVHVPHMLSTTCRHQPRIRQHPLSRQPSPTANGGRTHPEGLASLVWCVAPALGPSALPVLRRSELALDLSKDPVGVLVASARVACHTTAPLSITHMSIVSLGLGVALTPSELGPVEATCQDLGVAAAALFFRGPLTAVAIPAQSHLSLPCSAFSPSRFVEGTVPVHLIAGPLDRLAAALLGREFRDSAAVAELGQDADVLRLDRARACRSTQTSRPSHTLHSRWHAARGTQQGWSPMRLSSKEAPLNLRPISFSSSLKPPLLPQLVHFPHMLSLTCAISTSRQDCDDD